MGLVFKQGNSTMADLDLCFTSATELARRIATGGQSSEEIVANGLARIDEVNGTLNCFCFTYPEEALEKARAADAAVARGDALGPLHGVPIAIKDFTPTKGKTTTLGSVVYRDNVPDEDAQIVKDLLGAGAIMVGKTTTPEFAHDGFTHSPLWGTTRNPWNPERTPGGSSGGSGAAVASGCVPLAEGSDMGGSVRIPASFCGTVGLKPSLGRIPMTVLPTVFDNISHFGPLARTIDDAALFLDIAQGPFERDIMSNATPIDIQRPVAGDVKGLRIALDMDLGIYHVDDEVAANVEASAAALRDAGAIVEEVDLGWTSDCVDAWLTYWNVYLAAFFEQHLDTRRDDLDPNIAAMFDAARGVSAIDFKRLEFVRTQQWFKLCDVFERYDALICPTTPIPAPPADSSDAEQLGMRPDGKMNSSDMTLVFNNVAQCPALSVPSGMHSNGLPTSLQIIGHRFDDLTVLRIGAAVEKARPWVARRPEI
jgi:Asp-tRNA(Asn)/Glu-tRNA(Gln) amidotransferase A subunit family amidase